MENEQRDASAQSNERAPVLIRKADHQDTKTCAAILQNWIDGTPWLPNLHTLEETEQFMAGALFKDNTVLMAETGDEPCGYLAINAEGFVPSFTLAKEFRGRGIGSALLDAAKGLHPAGLSLWTFVANEGARRFYARHGFREVRRTDGSDNEERLPDILFEWGPGS
jgi:ribosomal protein S18 acetylase RimI-like enzyme